MTVTKEQDGSKLTVFIEGKLDALTSPDLEKSSVILQVWKTLYWILRILSTHLPQDFAYFLTARRSWMISGRWSS